MHKIFYKYFPLIISHIHFKHCVRRTRIAVGSVHLREIRVGRLLLREAEQQLTSPTCRISRQNVAGPSESNGKPDAIDDRRAIVKVFNAKWE